MSKLIVIAALVLSTLTAGCALDMQPEDEQTDSTEQAVSSFITTPVNTYYYQAGVYWYQDSYSGKWCTGATLQIASWDYGTTCNWNGWLDSSYHQYCTNGSFWQNSYYHYHCP